MQKTEQLEALIQSWGKVIVGYSGGVDSTLVAFAANKVLGRNALIVLASTETITAEDVDLAGTIAKTHHFNFRKIAYNELEIENYAANPVNRCYFCKQELYRQLGEIAKNENIPFILDGANLDDIGDYRPGRIAAKEYQVRSPLIEAQLTKQDVRDAALLYGLPNHDKPSAPCLSSRIPYGIMIDRGSISMIARAERYIREKGFTNVRVRHFQTTAKIEVDAMDIQKLKELFDDVQTHLKSLGYKEVLIDEEGFKSGKLNRGLYGMQNRKSRSAIHKNHKSALSKERLHASSLHAIEEYAKLDMSRRERTSIPEVIYCENKPIERIIAIARVLYAKQKLVLGTRCPKEFFPQLKKAFPRGLFLKEARSFRIGNPLPHVTGKRIGIVSAGTTDITACEEAALVLESLGIAVQRVFDVGVAGIHRLFASDTKLRDCDVLIVAAGMEGALPSVIAGLYPQPIIALPTSVGYGTALSGFTALFAMLTSCAPGVTVVNIDNGVGAAAAAIKILSLKPS